MKKSVLREYFESIVIAVILALFVRTWAVQAFKIPTGSMENNLLVGDHLLVNKFVFAPTAGAAERAVLPMRDIRRGDIVVFKQPNEPEVDYIKRLIGLPGDTVEVRRGQVYVNGQPLDEPYVQDEYRRGVPDSGPVLVEPEHYFVMGDHRNASYDSREWGQVPRGMIKGRALLIWYSFPEENGQSAGLRRQMRSWVEKAVYFPFRSRWSRCFTLIR